MAYEFAAASSQLIRFAGSPVSTTPMTLAGWYQPTTSGAGGVISVCKEGASQYHLHLLYRWDGSSGSPQAFSQSASGTSASSTKSSGSPINTLVHFAGVFSASNSRTVYGDASAGTTNTTSISPSGMDATFVGAGYRNDAAILPATGTVSECAIWSAALTVDEITSLSKGFKPYRVRPQNLVFYAPLVRELYDVRGALAVTNVNTATVANHIRVY